MPTLSPAEHQRSQRRKMMLIPVLVAVLAFVLFGSGQSDEDTASNIPQPGSPPEAPTNADPVIAAPPWPKFDLTNILAYDPFHESSPAVPIEEEPPSRIETVEPQEQLLTERMQDLTVSAIVQGPQGRAAIVDGRTVRIGDELPNGLQITDIDDEGIWVAPRP